MRKVIGVAACAAGAVGVFAAIVTGGASAAGSQPLTFFGDASHESFKLIDNPPKSPSRNPGSRRIRLSAGDEIVLRTPLLDHKGGTRIGTLFAEGTIVSGRRFSNAVIHVDGVATLGSGELIVAGIVRDRLVNTEAVTGGTGTFEGARGTVTEVDVGGGTGSRDTVHLLP